MGLSKKPVEDKKPISAAKLAELLKKAKTPKIEAELPKLTQVPTRYQGRPKIKIPEDIAPARTDASFVSNVPKDLTRFDEVLDNTIADQSIRMGIDIPQKGTHFYNRMREDILKNKQSFTPTTGAEGKTIFGVKKDFADSFTAGLYDFEKTVDEGIDFGFSDKASNIKKLNNLYNSFTPSTSLTPVENPIGYSLGGMIKPLRAGITGALTGAAVSGPAAPFGAGAGFLLGAGTTFALSAPEGVSYAYGLSLKDNYFKLKSQGLNDEEAYDKANTIAKASAGGETLMQGVYATLGAPGTANVGSIQKTQLFSQSSKSGFANTASKFVNNAYKSSKPVLEFGKPATFIGAEAALSKGISETEAIKQGVEKTPEEAVENSIKYGSDFAVMDMGIRGLLGMFKIPGYVKSQAKNMMLTADRNVVRDFVRTGEANGIYPEGSTNKIISDLNEQAKAKEKSPKYPGDDTREAVVSGLTLKLNNLVDEQSKLADVHKADLQPQIDDITRRIEIAKKSNNPLEAELHDDGTPLVTTEKTVDNATKKTTGEVEEGLPESSITERERVVGEQQKEAASQKTTDESGVGNRPIGSEEEVVTLSVADKIRRFKIDESVLTGGDKGVAQSSIVGLPIAIYNASIEAIAKGVEAGGVLADLIEQQVKALKEGGYSLDEVKFRKSVGLIDRASNQKAVQAAEKGMEGINSTDYAYLQRYAIEKYNDATGIYRDPETMAKALRDELNKKMDTSGISDETFELLAYDAVANKSELPFTPAPAKKITIAGVDVEPETIVTNPKEVFKAMYDAADNVKKGIEERFLGAANMISEYIKKKDKLSIAPKDISKAISRYITSKMDSETASEVFAENLSDIIESARDANQIAANKATIKKIKKDAKSPTYGTLGTRQSTDGIDFLSPNKIKDSVNPENVSEVTLLASEKRRKYQELLDDYRNSITGKPTKSNRSRLDLKEFIEAERRNFEEFQERKNVEKRAKSGQKYDRLVAEGKIKADEVSREEFVDADVNPTKTVSDDVEQAVNEAEVDKVEAYKQVVEQKRKALAEEKQLGNLDDVDADDIDFLMNADLGKVSPRNLKLFSNIIEDILNGEAPSRIGDLKSDIQAVDAISSLKGSIGRIRDISKAKYAGILRTTRKIFDKAYTGAEAAYEELGITNMIRAFTMNDADSVALRAVLLGNFEKYIKQVNTEAKRYTDTLYQIFAKDNVVIDGNKVSLKGVPALTEMNSQKLGIISALLNFDNPLNTINSIIESTKMLSALGSRKYEGMVKERLLAFKDLGIIDVVPTKTEDIQLLKPLESFDIQSVMSRMNRREQLALDFIINENKKIAEPLNKVNRNYYGESVDMSNPNYIGQTTFFTDVVEDFEKAFDEPVFAYNQVNKMRASSTMTRSREMIAPTGSNRAVHYDFDLFKTQPKKFHESLTTMMTTEETRKMAKLFARKEFQDFMKGKFNIEPKLMDDNMRVFKNILTEYVNGERKPYVVTREISKQRSAISKFLYSRMLNSLEAGALQSLPNIPSLVLESPQSFAKSMEITGSSLFDESKRDALTKFLSQTSKASRVNAGFEALTKSAKSISDNSTLRFGSNAYKNFDNFLGLSIEYGDRLTTVHSLLTGYIKGLIKSGKIKSAAEFDIVAEVEKGLDQYALSNAETLMSFINNESSTYGKAKVFRKDWASVMRMLQSFSHNSATNFLIDLGRFTDEAANSADRIDAAKRMTQYMFGTAGYGLAAYYINDMKTKFARDYMKSRGIIKEGEDLDKAVEQDREKTQLLMTNGILFDALLSRQDAITSEIIKGGLDMGYNLLKKPLAKEKEVMGEDTRNTILGKEYSPFYEGKYLGTTGSFISDMERLVTGLSKDDTNGDYRNLLSDKQREAQSVIRDLQSIGLMMPSKDLRRATASASKALRQGKITQLEMDAQNYIVANGEVGDYEQFQIDEARKYMDEQRALAKNPKEFDAYVDTKVKDFAENKIMRQELIAKAKQYGDAFSKDVVNIKAASPNRKIVILNNRFPDNDMKQPVVRFMLENKVITPEDYAMSLLFDKNGNPKNEVDVKILMMAAANRYIDAASYLGLIKSSQDTSTSPMTAGPSMEDIQVMITKMMSERYTRGKLQE